MKNITKNATDHVGVCIELLLGIVLIVPCTLISIINQNGLALLITVVLVAVSVISIYRTYSSTVKTVMLLDDRIKIFANGKEEKSIAYSKCTVKYNGARAIFSLKPFSLELTIATDSDNELLLIPSTKKRALEFIEYFELSREKIQSK